MNFEHELKTGDLSQLLPNLPKGIFTGSLALYIYGLVTEINPVIYNADFLPPVDLNKEEYLGVPIDFEATPGGFRIGEKYFNSLEGVQCHFMSQASGHWVAFKEFPIVYPGSGIQVLMSNVTFWPYKVTLFGETYKIAPPFEALLDAHKYEEMTEEVFMEVAKELHTFVMPSFIQENLPF